MDRRVGGWVMLFRGCVRREGVSGYVEGCLEGCARNYKKAMRKYFRVGVGVKGSVTRN